MFLFDYYMGEEDDTLYLSLVGYNGISVLKQGLNSFEVIAKYQNNKFPIQKVRVEIESGEVIQAYYTLWESEKDEYHLYRWDIGQDAHTLLQIYKQPVKKLLITETYLVLIFENIIEIVTKNGKTYSTIATRNPVSAVNYSCNVLVCLKKEEKVGSMTLVTLKDLESSTIQVHQNEVKVVAVNQVATKIASVSKYGTLIKVTDTQSKAKVKELRRGLKSVSMYDLQFSKDGKALVCYGQNGKIHLWTTEDSDNSIENRTSHFSYLSYIGVSYYSSEWSSNNVNILAGEGICFFHPKDNLRIYFLGKHSDFYEINFHQKEPKPIHTNLLDIYSPISERKNQSFQIAKRFDLKKIPVLLSPLKDSPIILKNKFLIPSYITVDQLSTVIKSKLQEQNEIVQEHEKVELFIDSEKLILPHQSMSEIYNQRKKEDGFVWLQYVVSM